MRLTEEQQKLAEDNHNLIYYILRNRGLSDEEYYDIAAIGLCKAAAAFDSRKSKFSTYACTCMQSEINHHMRKLRAAMRTGVVISLDAEIPGTDGFTYADILPDPNCVESYSVEQTMQERIHSMNPRQRRAVELSMQGMNQRGIADVIGISQAQISRLLKKAKRELTKLM